MYSARLVGAAGGAGYVKLAWSAPAPVITTDTDSIYIAAASAPAKPTGGTSSLNHLPSGWSRSQPSPTATENVYRSRRTRTYSDGVFTSATFWGTVTKVADKTGVVSQSRITRYARAASPPAKPSSSTETPGAPWTSTSEPSPTATLNVYRLSWTRTYRDSVFESASGTVTKVADKTGSIRIDGIEYTGIHVGSTRYTRLYIGSTRYL